MKFWIGNLSKSATNTIVFAKLITRGKNYGVHCFVIEVRNRTNH